METRSIRPFTSVWEEVYKGKQGLSVQDRQTGRHGIVDIHSASKSQRRLHVWIEDCFVRRQACFRRGEPGQYNQNVNDAVAAALELYRVHIVLKRNGFDISRIVNKAKINPNKGSE